jgi:hypothetical protein
VGPNWTVEGDGSIVDDVMRLALAQPFGLSAAFGDLFRQNAFGNFPDNTGLYLIRAFVSDTTFIGHWVQCVN